MSQAYKIREFLVRSSNRAADRALVLGLRRAEDAYQTPLLEAILERGQLSGNMELIRNYHHYSPSRQQLVCDHVDRLHRGLRQGSQDVQPQTRLNVLTIIAETGYRKLTDVVAIMLRDRDPRVARQGGQALQTLALNAPIDAADIVQGPTEEGQDSTKSGAPVSEEIFLSALEMAVQNYKLHRRWESVLAAMCAVPATETGFWKNCLESYHLVGKVVRQLMLNTSEPALAGFCVSALAHSDLRGTAVRALANQTQAAFVGGAARAFSGQADRRIRYGMSLLRQVRWLDPELAPPGTMDEQTQAAMVDLVASIGGPSDLKANYLGAIGAQGGPEAGLRAVEALEQFDGGPASAALRQAADSPHETVAWVAVAQLLKTNRQDMHSFMRRQLKSPHERVRELARAYLQRFVFTSYCQQFDQMNAQRRIAAGRTLFKVDGRAWNRWRRLAKSNDPEQRLRAVSMVRLLEEVDASLPALLELAGDSDHRVRSCAVAALGQARQSAGARVEETLAEALKDDNARVRANAVEALEQRGVGRNSKRVVDYVNSSDSRVRANAIKALLAWRVKGARQAIEGMMTDRRPAHRRSGAWVVQEILKQRKLAEVADENTEEASADVALAVS